MPCRYKQIQKRKPILHGSVQKHSDRRLLNLHPNLSANLKLLRNRRRSHLYFLSHIQQQSNKSFQKSKTSGQDNNHSSGFSRLCSCWYDARANSYPYTIFRGFCRRGYRRVPRANWQ